jgi:drug/metabolite transporter (DMT)-like permease
MPHISLNLGEISALLSAITWAFAVICFKKSGEIVHPIALNLFKIILAIILFLPTMWIMGFSLQRNVPFSEYLLLMLSGILGIGISDTLFLQSLNLLGAGLSAIVDCLYSPFIIGLSLMWLNEKLTLLQIMGALLIVSVVLTATSRKGVASLKKSALLLGILYGVLAMATVAVGIVMIKPLLDRSPLLWVTEVRLFGGLLSLLFFLLLYPKRKNILSTLTLNRGWGLTILGCFLGAYLAMIFWLMGMKYTQASLAAAFSQTSNVMVFIFAWIFLKEPINLQRSIGIVLAVVGVFLMTLI